jgi:hypothetical protein
MNANQIALAEVLASVDLKLLGLSGLRAADEAVDQLAEQLRQARDKSPSCDMSWRKSAMRSPSARLAMHLKVRIGHVRRARTLDRTPF